MSEREPWESDERQREALDDPTADERHEEEDDEYRATHDPN